MTTDERIVELERIVRVLAEGLLLQDAAKDLDRNGVKKALIELLDRPLSSPPEGSPYWAVLG